MSEDTQVLRFAVGTAVGPRSETWRFWVPRHKSDVYVSGRSLGNAVKVSLHEPGPSRYALTKEWVPGFHVPKGRDRRLAVEWERPRPRPPRQSARPFSIIVPWDEVLDRGSTKTDHVIWIAPPPEGTCIHFDVVYTPAGAVFPGHPGARSMGTGLIGAVHLANGERVFVTWLIQPMTEATRLYLAFLRSARIVDADGTPIDKPGILTFERKPNPDAQDGTEIGMLLSVTRWGETKNKVS